MLAILAGEQYPAIYPFLAITAIEAVAAGTQQHALAVFYRFTACQVQYGDKLVDLCCHAVLLDERLHATDAAGGDHGDDRQADDQFRQG